jgi:hypothetical protein
LTKAVLAAPESALPSLPTALVSQDWANADPTANDVIKAARRSRFIVPSNKFSDVKCMEFMD